MIYFSAYFVPVEGVKKMSDLQKSIVPMDHYNMSDFLRGQSSKIITSVGAEDKTGFILKNGKPIAVIMSNDRYERLLKSGIDINEY